MKTGYFITARLKSSRLKRKILLRMGEQTILDHVIERAKLVHGVDDIVLCTSVNPQDSVLFDYALVSSVKDAEVIWAAALFVARGGNLDQAIEICSKTMSNRMYRSLLSREVKTMKRISSILKSKKPRRDLKKLIKTIYIGS